MRVIKIIVVMFAAVGCLALALGGYYVYSKVRSGGLNIRNPINIAKPGSGQATTTPLTSSNPENAAILQEYQKTPVPAPAAADQAAAAGATPGSPAAPVATLSAAAQLAARPVRTPDAATKVIRSWPTGKKWVALTFDDGPHPEWTPKFIDLLKSKNTKATFFLIGPNVEKNPDVAKLLVENGFEVANHTMTHPEFRSASVDKIRNELQGTTDRIVANTGVAAVTLMRPPFGQYPPKVQQVCEEMGLKIVCWNVDTDDWRSTTNEDKMTSNVMKNLQDGSIILMHDRSEKALNTTSRVIDLIRAKGYEFVTVSELLGFVPNQPIGSTAGAKPSAAAAPGAAPDAPVAAAPTVDANKPLPTPASIDRKKLTTPPPAAR